MQNELRVARARRPISQLKLATEAGLTENRYWRIENGYAEPTPDERAALARVLDTTEESLFPELAATSPAEGEAAR